MNLAENTVVLINSKSGDLIEPVLKPQWWVNCQPLAEEAVKVGVFINAAYNFSVIINIAYSGRRVSNHAQTVRE